jgi:hypothetical protein
MTHVEHTPSITYVGVTFKAQFTSENDLYAEAMDA